MAGELPSDEGSRPADKSDTRVARASTHEQSKSVDAARAVVDFVINIPVSEARKLGDSRFPIHTGTNSTTYHRHAEVALNVPYTGPELMKGTVGHPAFLELSANLPESAGDIESRDLLWHLGVSNIELLVLENAPQKIDTLLGYDPTPLAILGIRQDEQGKPTLMVSMSGGLGVVEFPNSPETEQSIQGLQEAARGTFEASPIL